MDAMNSPDKTTSKFDTLLSTLRSDFPDITFELSDNFRWSDERRTIFYDDSAEYSSWSLLHEMGHMVRHHRRYSSDRVLVHMEVEAWEEAKNLARTYGHTIDEDYIQDCIDSYRLWRHQRSTCPRCEQTGVEKADGLYLCINCRNSWQVTTNRFCRVYRKKAIHQTDTSGILARK